MRYKVFPYFLLLSLLGGWRLSAQTCEYETLNSGRHIILSFLDKGTCILTMHYDYPVPEWQQQTDTFTYRQKGNKLILHHLTAQDRKTTVIPFPDTYYSALDYIDAEWYSINGRKVWRNERYRFSTICRKSNADGGAHYIIVGSTLQARLYGPELLTLQMGESGFVLLARNKSKTLPFDSKPAIREFRKTGIDIDSLCAIYRVGTLIKKDAISKVELQGKIFSCLADTSSIPIQEELSFVDSSRFIYTQSIYSVRICTICGYYTLSGSNVILHRQTTFRDMYTSDDSNLQIHDSVRGFYILNNITTDTLLFSNGLLAYSKVYNRDSQPGLLLHPDIPCIDCCNRSIDRPTVHRIKIFVPTPDSPPSDQDVTNAFDRYFIPVNYFRGRSLTGNPPL